MNGADRVEFADVQVIEHGDVMRCMVGTRLVAVPPSCMLPGATISQTGDRGRLVLPREVALNLRLVCPV